MLTYPSFAAAVAPDVVFNDELTWLELLKRIECRKYHNIVISPGPGTPHCAADIGGSSLCQTKEHCLPDSTHIHTFEFEFQSIDTDLS